MIELVEVRPILTAKQRAKIRREAWVQFCELCHLWDMRLKADTQRQLDKVFDLYFLINEDPPPAVYMARFIAKSGRSDLKPAIPDKRPPKKKPVKKPTRKKKLNDKTPQSD